MNEMKLIKACQNGDQSAFNELIVFYYPYVSGYLLKLTANECLTDDLTQDTFVRIIRNIEKFDVHGPASFSTYLITISKHLYIDYLRKNKHEQIGNDDVDLPSDSFEKKIYEKLDLDDVLKQIDRLPFHQATAIKMKYLEELTLEQIAAQQNTQAKTIKSRIHSGMKKLRHEFLNGGGNRNG